MSTTSRAELIQRRRSGWGPTLLASSLILSAGLGCRGCEEQEEQPTSEAHRKDPGMAEEVVRTERPALHAGSWYSADAKSLAAELDQLLAKARAEDEPLGANGALVGIIAPHAGYRYSGRVAASAYRLVADARPKRIFVLGPSHHARLRGVALVEAKSFATPLGALTIDLEALQTLSRHPLFLRQPDADAEEHSVEMQMPFIKHVAPEAVVVPLVVGALTLEEVKRVAQEIRSLLRPGDLVVASSDFTHYGPNYGYLPFADSAPEKLRELDLQAWKEIASKDTSSFWRFKHRTEDTICGFYPVSILMEIGGSVWAGRLVRYDTSGAITQDFTNSVSYLAAAFHREEGSQAAPSETPAGGLEFMNVEEQKLALTIARRTLEAYFDTREVIDPVALGLVRPGRLEESHGVFVTLTTKADRALRGCIGTVIPSAPLYRGIVENALAAAFRDHRFLPLRKEELPAVELELTVLTPPKPVDGLDDITIGRDGIILARDGRSALFLPQVAVDQGWGLVRTLAALSHKAGLGQEGWRGASFQIFQGHVFEESHL